MERPNWFGGSEEEWSQLQGSPEGLMEVLEMAVEIGCISDEDYLQDVSEVSS